jgi:glycosyltransferase involved in cell wall biosynthesis
MGTAATRCASICQRTTTDVKVLHLASGNLFGGVETMLLTLARERNLAPQMIPLFAVSYAGQLARELSAAGVSPTLVGEVRISRPWTVARARRRLRSLLARENPDVVICHGVWAHVVFGPAVRRTGTALCLFLHDIAQGRHWLERWARLLEPDLLIANSSFTAKSAARLFPNLHAEVHHCPVSPGQVATPAERLTLRHELGLRPDQVVVIQACRLERWKGHRRHLQALAALRERTHWISLVIGGPQRAQEERYLSELKREAAELGIVDRVRFLGQRSDARRLLSAADIHLQPNEGPEPYGLAFVEAMLAGLPVLTFRLGALPELVGESEGILVDSPRELAEKLGLLLEQPELRQSLGQNARRRALELSAPAVQLPALQRLLEAALERRPIDVKPSQTPRPDC